MTDSRVITTIDLASVADGSDSSAEELDRARSALEQVGAFYVVNHGVSEGTIARAYEATLALHRLDEDLKRQVAVGVNDLARGWHQGSRASKGAYESFEIGLEAALFTGGDSNGVFHGPNVWPNLPTFREGAYSYFEALLALAMRLVPVLAHALGLSVEYLLSRATQPCCLLRLLHYDSATEAGGEVGIHPHTDFELFTILSEDAPGLAVCGRDGTWHDVAAHASTELLVMAGDLLEIVTGGLVESPLHQVVGVHERRSLAFFFGLDASATVSPQLPVHEGREDLYCETAVGMHLAAMYVLSYPHIRARYERGEVPGLDVGTSNPFKQYKLARLAHRSSSGEMAP